MFVKQNIGNTIGGPQGSWTMEIKIGGTSFDQIKNTAAGALKRIVEAKHVGEWPISYGSSDGSSVSVSYQSPVEHQILQLRERADQLEKQLMASKE
jgi:hypothetical protein